MLETIVVVLLVLWALGTGFHVAAAGLVNLILLLAAIVLIIRIVQLLQGK